MLRATLQQNNTHRNWRAQRNVWLGAAPGGPREGAPEGHRATEQKAGRPKCRRSFPPQSLFLVTGNVCRGGRKNAISMFAPLRWPGQ
eukprot:7423003-Lingulodinium_polyedra.AAC.1